MYDDLKPFLLIRSTTYMTITDNYDISSRSIFISGEDPVLLASWLVFLLSRFWYSVLIYKYKYDPPSLLLVLYYSTKSFFLMLHVSILQN